MNRKYFTTFALTLLVAGMNPLSLNAAEKTGKHLFVLSGQSNMARFNEKVTFVPAIEEKFGKENVVIIKDAQGGQPIQRWYHKWEGAPGKSENGDLYDRLMSKVKPAIEGINFETVTFLWMQGEANSKNAELAAPYKEALKGVYDQLCNDLGRTDVFFVNGRLSDHDMKNENWKAWTTIRTMQEELAASDPKFILVNTDDCNDGEFKGKQQVNGLHYTADGYALFGTRLAAAAISLITKTPYEEPQMSDVKVSSGDKEAGGRKGKKAKE